MLSAANKMSLMKMKSWKCIFLCHASGFLVEFSAFVAEHQMRWDSSVGFFHLQTDSVSILIPVIKLVTEISME